jgi:hypothetical protein
MQLKCYKPAAVVPPNYRSFSQSKPDKKIPKISILNYCEEENSKYEGEPLIQPKIPYQFTVKQMDIDPKWTFLQKFNYRLKFVSTSFLEYLQDIFFWRVDPLVFKTAEFYKRNFNKARMTLSHIIYELKKVKRGFINLKNDCLYVLGLRKKQANLKYKRDSYTEGQKVR